MISHKLYMVLSLSFLLSCNTDPYKKNEEAINADSSSGQIKKYHYTVSFEQYPATMFSGKLADPDFTGNRFATDETFTAFIKEGCKKNGINFAGHYTVLTKSCGAMCVLLFMVDRINGKIYTDTGIREDKYGYIYKPHSRLLVANASAFIDDRYEYFNDRFATPELYVLSAQNLAMIK